MYTDFLRPIENDYTNSGDSVYYVSGISYFYSKNINTKFITIDDLKGKLKEEPDWVRKNFEICIMMEANIFFEGYNDLLKSQAELIKSLKVPTYILGAGAQSDKDNSIKFIDKIKENTKLYLDSIYSSGGEITLRGNFTKYVLEQIYKHDFFVSGCPSMYFRGRNLEITNDKVKKHIFKPMLNASNVSDLNIKIYKDYENSVYFDQDKYLKTLYCPMDITDYKALKYPFKYLYENKRIDGDMNYYLWSKQVQDGQFNFSYGSRIHGNFIALQNGIPSFVKVIDSRTRELAEFFNIPNSEEIAFDESKDNLYDLYLDIDYTKFNNEFYKKYDAFLKFLNDNNIPNCLENNYEFKEYLSKLEYYDYRQDKLIIEQQSNILNKLPSRNRIAEIINKINVKSKMNFYKALYSITKQEKYNKSHLKYKTKLMSL